jgi:MFS family permease
MPAVEAAGAGERESEERVGPGSPPNAPWRGPAALQVLRHREFALFWSGQAVSLVGTWMQAFAQGWLVQGLTTSASALGLINFASSIPTLLLMPLGGLVADRSERRRILLVTQWVMMSLAALTGALLATGKLQLWHLYPIALALGVCMAFEMPAYQSFYPQLVDRHDLPRAIALNQSAFHGARIIGPAVAAWIVARWGTEAAFFANAASFLAVIATLSMIRPRPAAARGGSASAGEMIKAGVHYVRQRPLLKALLGITAITTFFVFPNLAVLMPYYASHVLKTDAGGMGLMMTLSGIGSLVGSGLLLNVPKNRRTQSIAIASASHQGPDPG